MRTFTMETCLSLSVFKLQNVQVHTYTYMHDDDYDVYVCVYCICVYMYKLLCMCRYNLYNRTSRLHTYGSQGSVPCICHSRTLLSEET